MRNMYTIEKNAFYHHVQKTKESVKFKQSVTPNNDNNCLKF